MNIYIIVLISVLTICITRYIMLAFPDKYFSVQDIVSDDKKDISLIGFWIRFGIIFLGSFVMLYITNRNIASMIQYSFFVALLLIWPFILNNVIFRLIRTKKQKEGYYEVLDRKANNKLLVLNLLYGFVTIAISLVAIPIYDAIHGLPSNLYQIMLGKYVKLDPLMQQVVIGILFWVLPTIGWKSIKTKAEKKE